MVALVVALSVAVLALAYVLWSQTRTKHGRWAELDPQDWRDDGFATMLGHLTLSRPTHGNAVDLLEDGRFWDEVEDTIRGARSSVHFETFLWTTGQLSDRLVSALCDAARRGVSVRLLVDAEGGKQMADTERSRLQDAGAALHAFRPRTWRELGDYNKRDHRKVLVVDSRTAFVGGHCVTDDWLMNDEGDRVRDMSLRLTGPIVNDVQRAFAENWTEASGRLLADVDLFPEQPRVGEATALAAFLGVGRRVSTVKTLYVLAIEAAQERLDIMNPYFLPDRAAQEALGRAVARGVRVRVMVPTSDANDQALVAQASMTRLAALIDAGVEVYGYQRSLMHQKVICVDRAWVIAGSTNFDPRSFDINEEISVCVFDEDLAAEVTSAFDADADECERVSARAIRERPLSKRVLGSLAWRLRSQL